MMAFWRFWRFEEDLTLSLSWFQIKGHPVNTEFLLPPSVSVLTGFDRTYQALNQTLQTTNINYEKLLGYQVVKNTQSQSVFFFKFVHPCLRLFCRVIHYFFKYTVFSDSLYNTINNLRDTTHIDSEDDYRTGCRIRRKPLSTTTVLFMTTFTRWIIRINLLMILFMFYHRKISHVIVNHVTNWLQQPYDQWRAFFSFWRVH